MREKRASVSVNDDSSETCPRSGKIAIVLRLDVNVRTVRRRFQTRTQPNSLRDQGFYGHGRFRLFVAWWCLGIRERSPFNLARLVDPSYDTGAYARIRPRGEGYGVRGSRHVVTVPRAPSQKLAVLYGLLCGDGSLTSYEAAARQGKWRIDFAESDPEVVVEYARLTKEVFGVSPSVRNRKRWYEVYYCSKVVYGFYSRVLGHRTGANVCACLRLLVNSSVEGCSPGQPGGGGKLRRV